MNRRGFLGGILAGLAAPAIVRADSLMRIVPRETWVMTGGAFLRPKGWAMVMRTLDGADLWFPAQVELEDASNKFAGFPVVTAHLKGKVSLDVTRDMTMIGYGLAAPGCEPNMRSMTWRTLFPCDVLNIVGARR